jgi:hypothetical protein
MAVFEMPAQSAEHALRRLFGIPPYPLIQADARRQAQETAGPESMGGQAG